MSKHAHNRKQRPNGVEADAPHGGGRALVELERLMEEINVLRLEGVLFCFDPREARRRSGNLTVELPNGEHGKHAVTLDINQTYGQPSVLAYRVLQAIFLKLAQNGCQLTEDGRCLYPGKVSFTFRELARLCGRTWSGRTSQQIAHAIMQLHTTRVQCSLYDKETKAWAAATFYVTPSALFSGRDREVQTCVIELDSNIVKSINKRHFAFFNLQRLNALDTIGVVLYKRIFFHLSNLNQKKTAKHELRYEKDYEDICREWLGGLKPERYASRITSNQLGRHLTDLMHTQLIRKYEIKEKAKGGGFKLVFWPGKGFFDDYRDYYVQAQQPRLPFPQSPELREIQQPLELVAHFHTLLGHEHRHYDQKETAYAAELLADLSEAEVRDLIEYAVEKAKTTDFKMRWFSALRLYLDPWRADRARRAERESRIQAVAACIYCDERGYLPMKDAPGNLVMTVCPHDIERLTAIEDKRGLRRI